MTQFEFALKCDDSYETNVASTDRLQTNHSPNRSLNCDGDLRFVCLRRICSAQLHSWAFAMALPLPTTASDQILHVSWIEFLGRQKLPINRVVALIICHLRDPLASQRSVQLFSAFCFTFSPSSSSTHTPTLTPQQTPPSSSPQLMKQFLISCSLPEEIK